MNKTIVKMLNRTDVTVVLFILGVSAAICMVIFIYVLIAKLAAFFWSVT
jgi:hypothetical protein